MIRTELGAAAETPAASVLSAPYASYWFSFTYYLPPALLVGQEALMS
ncbi:MAG TPA: hypothetical protein VGR08_13010 [Thermomicrobiales bacterium]|nr:hypothetical protein [Thermomicrobiales bacterium]